jgi:uncharacterized membrane protein YgcG
MPPQRCHMCFVINVRVARAAACASLGASFTFALLILSGCAHVAPYERERLAHSTMTTEDVSRASESHVRSVHEGAVGGGSSSGGGCGCN